jgi:hypothetical protein
MPRLPQVASSVVAPYLLVFERGINRSAEAAPPRTSSPKKKVEIYLENRHSECIHEESSQCVGAFRVRTQLGELVGPLRIGQILHEYVQDNGFWDFSEKYPNILIHRQRCSQQ